MTDNMIKTHTIDNQVAVKISLRMIVNSVRRPSVLDNAAIVIRVNLIKFFENARLKALMIVSLINL
jgi:hypothetical protein